MEYFIGLVVLFVIGYAIFNKKSGNVTVSTKTVSTPAPAPAPQPVADANNNGIVSKAELKKLTKVQLVEFADKKNLKIKRSGTKASVINDIHSQLK